MPAREQKWEDRNYTVASSTQIAWKNPDRYYLLIVNIGANSAYVRFRKPAVTSEGIMLSANGGSYEINLTNPYNGEVFVISSGTTIALIEGSERATQ